MAELEIPDLSNIGIGGTTAGAGALALYWTFGPSLKSVGNVFGEWTEYRLRNLLRIGDKVAARQNSTTNSDSQGMHPRVAKMLIEEASWVDDNVHQEYLAGLFIASRSPEGVSDDGVYYARIVAGLTASQVHMHYGVYAAYAGSYTDANLNNQFNGSLEDRRQMAVVAPTESYRTLTGGGDPTEQQSSFAVASNGLIREGLIEDCAPPNGALNASHTATVPSLLGAIIYHRAMGYTTPGIGAIRSDRQQLARINPSYVFAQLDPEPPPLQGALVMAV